MSGLVAGAFPFFTLAQYYAYEARAHGMVLGWCGLALVCWQGSAEARARHLWLVGFTVSLMGALLTHVYAVYLLMPFAIVELCSLLCKDSIRWDIVAILTAVFTSVAWIVYLPLVHNYQTVAMPPNYFPASHDLIQRFLVNAVGPAIVIFLIAIILSSLDTKRLLENETRKMIPRREVILAGGFICMPLLGLIGCKLSHGPFLDRYFLASIAGYAIFLGLATSRWGAPWMGRALAGCMLFLMMTDLVSTAYFSVAHRIMLNEPSTGLPLSTDPSNPLQMYETLTTDRSGLDILVLPSLEYLFFFRYAPARVVERLYYGGVVADANLGGYEKLVKWGGLDLKVTQLDRFLANHDKFLLYGSANRPDVDTLQVLAKEGYTLKTVRPDIWGVMYEYEKIGSTTSLGASGP